MLIYSMSPSVDGFIADREGAFDWGAPSEEQFLVHLEQTRALDAFLCGRKLYEAMLVWETDPAMRETEPEAAFADVWSALPKIVFSRTLDRVEGNARLATAPFPEEAAAVLEATAGDVAVGGATLAGQAVELDLVDEMHLFRNPVLVGGGIPVLPPVSRTLALELVATRTFGDRVVQEHYRRVRDAPH